MGIKEILEYNFLNIGDYHLSLFNLSIAILVIFGAKFLGRILLGILKRFYVKRKVDPGRQFAVNQIVKYVLYTVALLIVLQALGIQLSVLWGGAAALLVGIGLGLQQTFNDLISGLILLGEGTVEVNDIVSFDGMIGKVKNIGIRTSSVETRDKIVLIIPNSKLVGENVTNWSHNKTPSRFQVYIGVAYSADIEMVTKILLDVAKQNREVLSHPEPIVHFRDFGNSSLDFTLHFFSEDYLGIDQIKSELRYQIIKQFRKNNIEIPFPQRDLWLRNPLELAKPGNGE